jgi:hypothetical protein
MHIPREKALHLLHLEDGTAQHPRDLPIVALAQPGEILVQDLEGIGLLEAPFR